MTETDRIPTSIIETYYEMVQSGTEQFDPERLRVILAPDLVFEGPIAGHRVGAEPFLKGVAGFVTTMRRLEMLHLLVTDNQAAALYDAELPGGALRFAEFFELHDGIITSLRLVFDPSEYRNRGGR